MLQSMASQRVRHHFATEHTQGSLVKMWHSRGSPLTDKFPISSFPSKVSQAIWLGDLLDTSRGHPIKRMLGFPFPGS